MAIREKIVIDATDYRRDLRYIEKQAEITARNTGESWERSSRTMSRATDRSGSRITGTFKKIGAAAKLYIAAIATGAFMTLRKAVERAQAVEETASKYETVLGPAIGKANEFIKENARLMGLSNTQAKETIATTTAIAQGMGFAREESAGFSLDIVRLAADLQSFNDVPIERTHRAITSALTGEREALKSLGIVIRETEVQERALANTGKDVADALIQQEKATATLELITERAGVAVGDLERTATSSANKTRQAMAGIQNLLNTLSTKLNQQFGPTLISWLENALEVAEDLVSTIQRGMSTDMQNLIRNLEALGGNEELVASLKKQQAINEAMELRQQLKEELSDIEIPVSIEEKGLKDKINSTMDTLKGTLFANPLNDFFGEDGGFMDTFNKLGKDFQDDFKTINESFDPAKIDTYKARIGGLQEELKAVTEQALKAEQMGFTEESESLTNLANVIADAISQMQLAIAKQEQLNNVNKSLVQIQNQGASAFQNQGDEALEQAKKFEGVVIGYKKIEAVWKNLGKVIDTGAGSIMKTHFDELINASETYQNRLQELDNELNLSQITQEEYDHAVEAATAKYLKQLQDTYEMFKNSLGPEQQAFFKSLISNLKKTDKESDKVSSSLGDIAESLNSVLSLADAFKDVDDNLRNVLRGSVDLLRNLDSIKKLGGTGFLGLGGTGLAGAIPAIGAAAGIVTMLSGFIGNRSRNDEEVLRQMKEMKDLRLSLIDLQRAVKENTKAYLGEPVVGGNIPTGDLERAKALFEALFTGDKDRGGEPSGYADEETFLSKLSGLADLFPKVFGEFEQMYQNLRDQGLSHTAAVTRLMRDGLGQAFRTIEDSFQEYGASIDGAIKRFNDAVNFGAMSTQEAFALFLEQLGKAGYDLEQTIGDKSLGELLNQLADPNLSDKQRSSIVDLLWENRESLMPDGVSFDDYTQFLDFIKGMQFGGESDPGFSKNVQFNRTITDVQANELVVLLESIEMGIWDLVESSSRNILSPGSLLPSDVIGDPVGFIGANNTSNTLSVNGISFNGGSPSDRDIDDLMDQLGKRLKRELKGRTF